MNPTNNVQKLLGLKANINIDPLGVNTTFTPTNFSQFETYLKGDLHTGDRKSNINILISIHHI